VTLAGLIPAYRTLEEAIGRHNRNGQAKWEALEVGRARKRSNGMADLRYSVLETKSLVDDSKKATKVTVDVKLNGDHWRLDQQKMRDIIYE
jgi:hypothetical protein